MGGGQNSGLAHKLGVAALVLLLLLGGAFFWFNQFGRPETVELNPADLCPRDTTRKVPAAYIVLIDQTDPLDTLARNSVTNAVIGKMQSDLEQSAEASSLLYGRIEVWTFGGAQGDSYKVGDVQLSLTRALAMCNPGAPEKWDHLYKNAGLVKRQHAQFYKSLRDVLDSSLNFKEAPQSPVIEALYGMGAKVFSDPVLADSRKKLLIVSDLMQNTRPVSFLTTGAPPFSNWRASNIGRQTMPNLTGVSVKAFVIPGAAPKLQNGAFGLFWMDLLSAAGVPDGGDIQKIQ